MMIDEMLLSKSDEDFNLAVAILSNTMSPVDLMVYVKNVVDHDYILDFKDGVLIRRRPGLYEQLVNYQRTYYTHPTLDEIKSTLNGE
jgi:hypothetical protein